jgi:hypothetical protein
MNDFRGRAEGRSPQAVACPNASKKSGLLFVETHRYDTVTPMWVGPVLQGGRFNLFCGFGGEAVSPIIGDRPIDDRSAVDAFPRIEDQEKV